MGPMLRYSALAAAALLTGENLRAGLYSTTRHPSSLPSLSRPTPIFLEQVQQERAALRDINDALHSEGSLPLSPTSLRPSYLAAVAWLPGSGRRPSVNALQAINGSEALIRLGRSSQAAALLEDTLRQTAPTDSSRFLLLLNLACAYQEEGAPELLPRAIEYQQEALSCWPPLWAGWDETDWRWHRRIEQYTLTLLRLRHRELIKNGGRSPAAPPLDALFGEGLQLVGPSGQYEAGVLAFSQWNKLPLDAERVVLALILAHPFDDRLYWLYGELVNARGDVLSARKVLAELSAQNLSRELRHHLHILASANPAALTLLSPDNSETLRKLFWAMAPRGQLLSPGVGDLCHEAAWMASILSTQPTYPMEPRSELPPPAPSDQAGVTSEGAVPGWREMSGALLIGVVVGLLLTLQWQEWRRRRHKST